MKQLIFAVYDSKSEMFNQPMFLKAKGEAIRAFSDEANRPDSAIYKHPGDYTLFCIGDYNVDTGLLVPLPTPTSLGLAIEYQERAMEVPSNLTPIAEAVSEAIKTGD